MGRNNAGSFRHQIAERLNKMQCYGESKYNTKQQARAEAKKNGSSVQLAINDRLRDKIYSTRTYENYYQQCVVFCEWTKRNYPACKTLNDCRPYVDTYLQHNIDRGLSAWTIKRQARRLGKLYQCPTSDFIATPARHRAAIKRSRGAVSEHYSEANNAELRSFCRATGLRREELETLKPEQLEIKSNGQRILHIKGKGGKEREAPIIGKNQADVVTKIQATPKGQKVWGKVHSHAPIHVYRGDYANAMYNQLARPITAIQAENRRAGRTGRKVNEGIYIARKDKAGKKWDKMAMLAVSKALGHERINVIANNYLR